MEILLAPPLAFLIYVGLVGALALAGRGLAGKPSPSAAKSSLYASGEAPPSLDDHAVPGYRPYFLGALFFAMLHLGIIVLSTSNLSIFAALYLLGLMMALLALILG